MDGVDFDVGALSEAVVFLEYFRDLPDIRQPSKVIYPLGEVLLLSLLAVLAGAETFVDIARFGDNKQAFCADFGHFVKVHRPTIILATFSQPSTRNSSSAVLSYGLRR